LERNSSSGALGGKTAKETRKRTREEEEEKEEETNRKQNKARGPKAGSGMVLSKGDMRQAVKTYCSSLEIDCMSVLCLELRFSLYRLLTQYWRTKR